MVVTFNVVMILIVVVVSRLMMSMCAQHDQYRQSLQYHSENILMTRLSCAVHPLFLNRWEVL